MESTHELKTISDDELLRRLAALLHRSRRTEADLVAHVGEVDARRLYAREASPSMFAYCTEVLHLSEAEAYLRIAAARASREHPVLLEMLADGRLHLTAVAKLAPHLSLENRESLLTRATHKSKREIEELIAELAPCPDVPAVMRKLPERRDHSDSTRVGPGGAATVDPQLRPDAVEAARLQVIPDAVAVHPAPGHPRPTVVEPLAPARYKIQFTASAELRDKLERLCALMRSSVPDGDMAVIIEHAVTETLDRLESRRFAQTRAPRPAVKGAPSAGSSPATRHVPAPVKRAVYERDGGRCRYVDGQGRRCTERRGLEFHHRYTFGYGGHHSVEGVCLLCRGHNSYLAEVDYGRTAMARHRRSQRNVVETAASSPPVKGVGRRAPLVRSGGA